MFALNELEYSPKSERNEDPTLLCFQKQTIHHVTLPPILVLFYAYTISVDKVSIVPKNLLCMFIGRSYLRGGRLVIPFDGITMIFGI